MISLNNNTPNGIDENQIINYKDYLNIPNNVTCYLCRKVVNDPVECTDCHSIYCFACWDFNQKSKLKCIMNCNSLVIKADELLLIELSKLKVKCLTCDANSISYIDYNAHCKECSMTHLHEKELNKEIDSKSLFSRVDKETNSNGIGHLFSFDSNHLQSNKKKASSRIDKSNKKDNRKYLLTNSLSAKNKMRLYNAVVAGDLTTFKELIINERFPLFEEISTEGYYWSALHYAMHNGKLDIIYYIFDTLISQGILELALECETNDARCPLLCLFNSDKLNLKEKREIFVKVMHNYDIKIPDRIYRACKKRGYLECLMIIKSKNELKK